jgi:hypothetical protein
MDLDSTSGCFRMSFINSVIAFLKGSSWVGC